MGGEGLSLPALLRQGSVKVTSEAEPSPSRPHPPTPSPIAPPSPGRGGAPTQKLKKEGWGFPLSRLAGGRWERGSGGEVQGCGASGFVVL